jgi:uncharacterized protein (DUF1800 family)
MALPAADHPTDPPQDSARLALHLLNRLGYGPRPGDVARVQALGADQYIEQQLRGDSAEDSEAVRKQLAPLATLRMSQENLWVEYNLRLKPGMDMVTLKAEHNRGQQPLRDAELARLTRALDSPQQLNEVMADFWFNHFNVFQGKGIDYLLVGDYERSAIRPYALGHFRDLLGATARHPAMLYYLDNGHNTAPDLTHGSLINTGGKPRTPPGLNENYAREVMELHTLGADGGYTQKDVTELARILTGWTFLSGLDGAAGNGSFYFDASSHDKGSKLFLGHHFAADGEAEGERALDMLAASPATAHHISYQLAQYFVADEPPPALVNRLAQVYLKTRGDIREVLHTLFFSAEFRAPATIGSKFKTPYQYIVSMLRAADVSISGFKPVASALAQLDMPLYGCLTPDGYKNTESAWRNPDAMIHRVNLAVALGKGSMQSRSVSGPPDPGQLKATLDGLFSPATLKVYDSSPADLRAAVLLASPEFMRR